MDWGLVNSGNIKNEVRKWARKSLSPKLNQLGISHLFMNRMRSLSREESVKNKQDVVALVKRQIRLQ